jgi:hypothetical protein
VQGEAVQAAHLLGAGEALLEAIGATPTPIEVSIGEQFAGPLKTVLGEERFATEWAAGRAIPGLDAIELGLTAASAPGNVPAPA